MVLMLYFVRKIITIIENSSFIKDKYKKIYTKYYYNDKLNINKKIHNFFSTNMFLQPK